MFSSNMREGSKEGARQVPVHEVTHDAFRCMLHFLYGTTRDAPRTHGPHASSSHHPSAPPAAGGAVTVPEDLAVELLGLADRYLLHDLKLLCGFTLARMISVETVCRIVQAADRWDARDSQLRAQCIECAMRRASDRGRPTASTLRRHSHPATHTPLLPLPPPLQVHR